MPGAGGAMLTAREACQELAKRTEARRAGHWDQICTLSRGIAEKKDKIVLVKDRKKPTQT